MITINLDAPVPMLTALDVLQRALDDPAVDLVYWRSATGSWIDGLGHPAEPPDHDGRVLTPLQRDGDWIAAIVHSPSLHADPERLRAATGAAGPSIDDERLIAELRAQVRDEQATRSRILVAGDRQRRRVERNLHDGAQQRLVGLALTLRLASRRAAGDALVSELLAEAVDALDEAIEDLRTLARGLHPAIVNAAGLAGAVETLAEHSGVPVELSIDLPERLPERVEVGAYYFVAEALANANKHAAAERVTVRGRIADDALHLAVSDDGRGGAAAAPGSGLEGLVDRVDALGGQLDIHTGLDQGTTITATIPLRGQAAVHDPLLDDILLRVVPLGAAAAPDRDEAPTQHTPWRLSDEDRRLRALKWIAWNNHEAPGDLVGTQSEDEDILNAKALLLCAGGNRHLSERQRDWILGYLTVAGHSERVIEAARVYDDSDRIEDLMRLPRMVMLRASTLYDALRACALDASGPTPAGLDPVLRAADAIGISRDVVGALEQIVIEEVALRRRRHELVVAPVLRKALHDWVETPSTSPGPAR